MADYDRYLDHLVEASQMEPEETIGGVPASWYEFNEDRSPEWDEDDEW